jgi:hypothetical protein
MNIAPVTIKTKRDSSKIHWDGVDTGAKILVGLRGDGEGAANAASAARPKGTSAISGPHGFHLDVLKGHELSHFVEVGALENDGDKTVQIQNICVQVLTFCPDPVR